MAINDFNPFRVITFDCYGTLIDWEAGILSTLEALLKRHGKTVPPERIVAVYSELEAEAESGPYRRYREILAQAVDGFGREFGFVPTDEDRNCIVESIPTWDPFPDTVAALKYLHGRFGLVVISNIDDDLFALTAPKLGVELDGWVTAQQARSYKPSLENFRLALEMINEPVDAVLHVAQSLYHDIQPAQSLGLSTVWINRKSVRPDVGLAPRVAVVPGLEAPDLKTFVSLVQSGE